MMKKFISVLLIVALSFTMATPALAEKTPVKTAYTQDEMAQIVQDYDTQAALLDTMFNQSAGIGYWSLVEDIKTNHPWISAEIDAASWVIGEKVDEQRCAEILANLITMQQGELAEQVEQQNSFDDLKDGKEYALDLVNIAADFVGAGNMLKDISPVINAAVGGSNVLVENTDQAKYYQISIREYVKVKEFLSAVEQNAEHKELKQAAKKLQKANETLLQKRLNYWNDMTASQIKYTADFFVKNMSFALLKETDTYANDETVKWFVDESSNLVDKISSTISLGKFTFRMAMLAGDIGFGTSNTFNRYQEMKITADIASALAKANKKITVSTDNVTKETVAAIQQKCEYYKMQLVTHARGEYLIYHLVVNDAGVLSELTKLLDMFKKPEETREAWYQNQVKVLTRYNDILDDLMEVGVSDWLDDTIIAQCGGMYPVGTRKASFVFRKQNSQYYTFDKAPGWENRQGIVSANIGDLDDNGCSELLVLYMKYEDKLQKLYAAVYEKKNNSMKLQSTVQIGEYNAIDLTTANVGLITINDVTYIYTENESEGILVSYWFPEYQLFSYQNGRLYRALWLGQSGGGTSEIEYGMEKCSNSKAKIEKTTIWQDSLAEQFNGRVGLYNDMGYEEAFVAALQNYGFPTATEETKNNLPTYTGKMNVLCRVESNGVDDITNKVAKFSMIVTDLSGNNTSTEKPKDIVWEEKGPKVVLTEEQAKKIAYQHWGAPTSGRWVEDPDEEIPTEYSVHYAGVEETKTKAYYHYNLQWLVDDIVTGADRWSSIDYLYIDAETGECYSTLPQT